MDKYFLPYAVAMFSYIVMLLFVAVLAAKNGYSEYYILSAGALISFFFINFVMARQEKALMKFCERMRL